MSNGTRRVTVVIDFEDTVSDVDAMRRFVDELEEQVVTGYVQDLPGLGNERWVSNNE